MAPTKAQLRAAIISARRAVPDAVRRAEVDDLRRHLADLAREGAVSYTHLTLPTNREV